MHREHLLKNGKTLIIRCAQPADAEETIQHAHMVTAESENLAFGPGDIKVTVEKQRELLEAYLTAENKIFLVATVDGAIIGITNFRSGDRPRTQHVGEFGLSVRKSHWGQGVGGHLLRALIDWARQLGTIRKINLRVRTDNQAAIRLYEKSGFEREGMMSREMIVDGEFVDLYVMGLRID